MPVDAIELVNFVPSTLTCALQGASTCSDHFWTSLLIGSSDDALVTTTSMEPIHKAFSVATFLPQPFWLLMILFPNQSWTKRIMGGLEVPLLLSLVHLFIVTASIVGPGVAEGTAPLAEFNDVFDLSGDPKMLSCPWSARTPTLWRRNGRTF